MNTPSEPQSSKYVSRSQEEIRDLSHARTRERLVKRVLAARKRLPQAPQQRRAA